MLNYKNYSTFETLQKDARGVKGAYSASKQHEKVKIPFGPPKSVEFAESGIGIDAKRELIFSNNRRESVRLNVAIMNNIKSDLNPFCQRIQAMKTLGQFRLLAHYVTLLQASPNFVFHDENINDNYGVRLDGKGTKVVDLHAEGGTLESYIEFAKLASENLYSDTSKGNKKSKTIDDYLVKEPAKKRLKVTEKVDESEQKELNDAEGLEVGYKKSYVGLARIPLKNLEAHVDLLSHVSPETVGRVMKSISQRYDPTQTVLGSYCIPTCMNAI